MHFAGFKLQSVYNHSLKSQSLESLRIKSCSSQNMLQMASTAILAPTFLCVLALTVRPEFKYPSDLLN